MCVTLALSNTSAGVSNTRSGVYNTRPSVSNTRPGVSNTHLGGLQAPAERNEVAEHQLMLGNCGDKGGGELVFENLAEAERLGFSLEPPGGKVDAGQKVPPPHLMRNTPPRRTQQ